MFRRDFQKAEKEIDRAADLSPNYFEVHRVRAMLLDAIGDVLGAEAAYERAISLAASRAALRLWFAQFLSRQLGDQDRALQQLLRAEELAPNSAFVQLECARVLQYHRKFEEADKRLKTIRDLEKLPARTRRVHLDLTLQNVLRQAEFDASLERYAVALECFEAAKGIVDQANPALVDQVTLRHIHRSKRQLLTLKRVFRGAPEENRVAVIEEWISSPLPSKEKNTEDLNIELVQGALDSRDGLSESPPNRGRLSQVHQNYAFIDTGGARFFFHRGKWAGRLDFVSLKDGSIVEFDIGQAEVGKGPTALNVRPIDDLPGQLDQQKPVRGTIKSLTNSYGFIKLDSGPDLFFHRTNCTAATRFRALKVGDRVRCVVSGHDDGRLFGLNVECYSGLN